jgi:hypothetical protein
MDAGSRGSQHSQQNGASGIGDLIAVRTGDFLHNPVRSQHSQFPADSRGSTPLSQRAGFVFIQQRLQVSVPKAVDGELAMVDSSQQFSVLSPGAQTPDFPAAPSGAFLNTRRQLFLRPAVVHGGQRVEQPVIGFLRYFGPPVQIGYPFAQRSPLKIFFSLPLKRAGICPDKLTFLPK